MEEGLIKLRTFLNRFYYFILVLFFPLYVFSQPLDQTQPNSCRSCYFSKQLECDSSCSKKVKTEQKRSCNKSCLIEACKSPCGYSKEESQSGMVSCDYCFQTKGSLCSGECSNNSSGSCYKRCLSRECGRGCRSPIDPRLNFESTTTNNAQACSSCKQTKEQECLRKCPSRDGSIACKFACERSSCSEVCE